MKSPKISQKHSLVGVARGVRGGPLFGFVVVHEEVGGGEGGGLEGGLGEGKGKGVVL